jgi:hypothetical protein
MQATYPIEALKGDEQNVANCKVAALSAVTLSQIFIPGNVTFNVVFFSLLVQLLHVRLKRMCERRAHFRILQSDLEVL